MAEVGTEEGETCGRNGCEGVIEMTPVENCSCFIRPPCDPCLESHPWCPVCEWEEEGLAA